MIIITFASYCIFLILAIVYKKIDKIKTNNMIGFIFISLSIIIFTDIVYLALKDGTNYIIIEKTKDMLAKDFPDLFRIYKSNIKTEKEINNSFSISNLTFNTFTNNFINLLTEKGIILFVSIIASIFTIIMFKFNVKRMYLHYLEDTLFNVNHQWMTENSLLDVVISVNIFHCFKSRITYNIDDYFHKELINKSQGLFVILGNAGEGKTVATFKIASLLLKTEKYSFIKYIIKTIYNLIINSEEKVVYNYIKKRIPILISFIDVKSCITMEDIENVINMKIEAAYGHRLINVILFAVKKRIKKIVRFNLLLGNFLIIVDGYDEINEDKRHDISLLLKKFMDEYEKCMYIVTSRTTVYLEEQFLVTDNDRLLYLSPLSKTQIFDFISKWQFPKDKSKRELYYKIIGNSQLEKIASNPLLLTLISYLYGKSKLILPNSITEFYNEALKCLLISWEETKKIPKRFKSDYDVKMIALSNIAYKLFISKENSISRKSIIKLIKNIAEEYGDSPSNVFEDIYNQSGLLEKLPDNTYKFYHRSFLEFFVAKFFWDNNIDTKILENDIKQYHVILLFYHFLLNNEDITKQYIKRNYQFTAIIEQIIIECDIKDVDLIRKYIFDKLNSEGLGDINYYQTLGKIAAKYKYVSGEIYTKLSKELDQKNDIITMHNVVTALLYFKEAIDIAKLINNNIYKINIKELIIQSDENINPVLQELMNISTNFNTKIQIIEGLSETGKADIMLSLFNNSLDNDNRKIVSAGFLQMTNSIIFLEWINEQNLMQNLSDEMQKKIKNIANKYGWRWNKLTKVQIYNIYVLIYYAVYYMDEKFNLNKKLINNKIKFIITYIRNDSNGTLNNYLIDIKDFEVKSIIEFKYHWKKINNLRSIGINPIWLNNILVLSFSICILILMFMQVNAWSECYSKKIYIVKLIKNICEAKNLNYYDIYPLYTKHNVFNINISRYIDFNSNFIMYYLLWYYIQFLINNQLIEKEYNFPSICLNVFIELNFLLGFFLTVQNNYCRITATILVLIVIIVGTFKHKNNYPSFRQPQFEKIRIYLEEAVGSDIL